MEQTGTAENNSPEPNETAPAEEDTVKSANLVMHKIPRPPNAFMIFANEHRKTIAKKFPKESNKEISIRLGKMWRMLPDDTKSKYHAQAKVKDLEHKKKYPDYVYNPRDARLRKEARRQRILAGQHLARALSQQIHMVKQAKGSMLQFGSAGVPPSSYPHPVALLQNQASQQQMQEMRKAAIRDQVYQGLNMDQSRDSQPYGYFVAQAPQAQHHVPQFRALFGHQNIPMHMFNSASPVSLTSPPSYVPLQFCSPQSSNGCSSSNMMPVSYSSQMNQSQMMNATTSEANNGLNGTMTNAQTQFSNTNHSTPPSNGKITKNLNALGNGNPEGKQVSKTKNALLALADEALSQAPVQKSNAQLTDKMQNSVNRMPTDSNMPKDYQMANSRNKKERLDNVAGDNKMTTIKLVKREFFPQQQDMQQQQSVSYPNQMPAEAKASPTETNPNSKVTVKDGNIECSTSKTPAKKNAPMYIMSSPNQPYVAVRSTPGCISYSFSPAPVSLSSTPQMPKGPSTQQAPSDDNSSVKSKDSPQSTFGYSNMSPGTNIQEMGGNNEKNDWKGSAVEMGTSPTAYSGMVHRGNSIWAPAMDPHLVLPPNQIYSPTALPSYGNNYGSMMPWSNTPLLYVPVQEIPSYQYASTSQGQYEQYYTTASGHTIAPNAENKTDKKPVEFRSEDERSANKSSGMSQGDGNQQGNFGNILTSTMFLLSDSNESQSTPLRPTCHITYEQMQNSVSPNRQLAELNNAEPMNTADQPTEIVPSSL